MSSPNPSQDEPTNARYRPWWYRLAFFLGTPPTLPRRQWSVLGLVSLVSLFELYDIYLFALCLKHIQADLGIAESEVGRIASIMRAGSLPAFLIAVAADRLGRRRILLVTVVMYTLLTGATAFAPNLAYFVTVQFAARTFAMAETLIAVVVIAEEFAPEHRGWGIGALGALHACGAGLAALMFALIDVLPYGWRALYLVGVLPLLLLARWRRNLPETQRFSALQQSAADAPRAAPTLAPVMRLARQHGGRCAALAVVAFVFGLASGPAALFAPKYLQDINGWAPGTIALLNLAGGALAIIANPLAGRLSDRRGRKPVTTLFALLSGVGVIAFYSSAGVAVGPLWILMMFWTMGAQVTLSTYGAELFPTSQRATASGLRFTAMEVGAIAGLSLVSTLYELAGSNWRAISTLGAVALLAPLVVRFLFPETAGRALEEIAPETEADREGGY